MASIASKLHRDAQRIWRAGVQAVLPERLIPEFVRVERDWLLVGDVKLDLREIRRIAVVGAGKAAGALAAAFENALGARLLGEKQVTGWVNVPADSLVATQVVHLHSARAPGMNEPSAAGVEGSRRIVQIVSSLSPADVCFCLLTGGGSALLPMPVPEISLSEKIQVTRLLSAAGANIEQLNTVRQQLSLVKGGGLARACRARRLITLAISDVLGDPLDVIASGPTCPRRKTARDALEVLAALGLMQEPSLSNIVRYLQRPDFSSAKNQEITTGLSHVVLGNNATAVDSAGIEAERLGYSHAMIAATKPEGSAEDVGRHMAQMGLQMRDRPGPNCLISGGEPTVKLVDERDRGKGGRNQQLALAALLEVGDCDRICLLSGGTDGEDGPTDAAGAIVTNDVIQSAHDQGLDGRKFLDRNDAYSFFEQCGGLLKTGPTHTNVCDVRVLVVEQSGN